MTLRVDHRPPFVTSTTRLAALLLVASLGLLPGCGKVGPPQPPSRITQRTVDLDAVQRGAEVVLLWTTPPLGQREGSSSYITRVEIYRVAEQPDEEPVLDLFEFEDRATVVGVLDRDDIQGQLEQRNRLEFRDPVDLTAVAEIRLRYAIRYFNARGQSAPFSNTVALNPAPVVAMAPTSLRVSAQEQDLIRLEWDPPAANVGGGQPAAVAGYNVYRRTARRAGLGAPLNPDPVTEPAYVDRRFNYGTHYVYVVRALSLGSTGLVESSDSAPLELTPVDTFPPATPEPVTAASANGIVSLFWPNSPERDVVGYNVYRAESEDTPDEEWNKLTPQPITTVTFHDNRVVIGRRYFYRVSALDVFGNESERSATVGEIASP